MSSIGELRAQIQSDNEKISELKKVLSVLTSKRKKLVKCKNNLCEHQSNVNDYDLLKKSTWEGVLAFEGTLLQKQCVDCLKNDESTVLQLIVELDVVIEKVNDTIAALRQDIADCEAEIARLKAEDK